MVRKDQVWGGSPGRGIWDEARNMPARQNAAPSTHGLGTQKEGDFYLLGQRIRDRFPKLKRFTGQIRFRGQTAAAKMKEKVGIEQERIIRASSPYTYQLQPLQRLKNFRASRKRIKR